VNGAPTPVAGSWGRSLSYDGTADYLVFAAGGDWLQVGIGNFSIVASIFHTTGVDEYIFSQRVGTLGVELYVNNVNDVIGFYGDAANYEVLTGGSPSQNWHQHIMTINRTTNQAFLYLDGTQTGPIAINAAIGSPWSASEARHGRRFNDAYSAMISRDVVFFDRVLSQADANGLYNAMIGAA
jgi:hypothetical protein